MKHYLLVTLILSLLLASSCSFGVGSVSYELSSNIVGPGNPDVALVPHVAGPYIGKLSADPVFLNGYRQQLYLEKNPGSHEAKPEELVPEFSVYVNHVFLKTVQVSSKDYTRDEIQYPMYPKQVTYSYRFALSDLELKNALRTPANASIVATSITTTSFMVSWPKLTTNGMDAAGIKYRAILTEFGSESSYPNLLDDNDVDVTSSQFINLKPGTKYVVDVVFGDLDGQLGRFSRIQVVTDQLKDPTPPASVDLQEVRTNLVGKWQGTMSCPWWPVTQVTLEFFSDATYSCTSQTAGQTAMYYGSDADSSEKSYSVISVNSQSANMDFSLYFGPGNTQIEHVKDLKVDATSLSFSFQHLDQYGPLVYQLGRL